MIGGEEETLLFGWDGTSAPQLLALLPLEAGEVAFATHLDGEHLWLGTSLGLRVFWLGDPAQPLQIAWEATPFSIKELSISADRVVAQGDLGLRSWTRTNVDLDLAVQWLPGPVSSFARLSWTDIPFASGYRVESAPDPAGPWTVRTEQVAAVWSDAFFGSVPGDRWYRVTALID